MESLVARAIRNRPGRPSPTRAFLQLAKRRGFDIALSKYRNRLPCGEPVAVGKTWRVALSTI
jgi:hypothetical protein